MAQNGCRKGTLLSNPPESEQPGPYPRPSPEQNPGQSFPETHPEPAWQQGSQQPWQPPAGGEHAHPQGGQPPYPQEGWPPPAPPSPQPPYPQQGWPPPAPGYPQPPYPQQGWQQPPFPGQPSYPQSQTQWPPPPAGSKKALWIVLGSVGVVLLLIAAGVVLLVNVVGATTNQAKDVADDFTRLMVSGEADNAYDKYLDSSFRQEVSKEDFIAGHKELELDASCEPTYSGVESYKEDGTKFAEVWGVLICDDKDLEFEYFFEGRDQLKVTEVWIEPLE